MKVRHPAMRWCLLGASLPVSPQFLPLPRGPRAPGRNLGIPKPAQITSSSMALHLLCAPKVVCWAASCLSALGDPLLPSSPPPRYLSELCTFHRALCWERRLPCGLPCHPCRSSTISLFFFQHLQICTEGLPCARTCSDGALTELTF